MDLLEVTELALHGRNLFVVQPFGHRRAVRAARGCCHAVGVHRVDLVGQPCRQGCRDDLVAGDPGGGARRRAGSADAEAADQKSRECAQDHGSGNDETDAWGAFHGRAFPSRPQRCRSASTARDVPRSESFLAVSPDFTVRGPTLVPALPISTRPQPEGNPNADRSMALSPPVATRATHSPIAAECLNPWPEHAEATITFGRDGTRSMMKRLPSVTV
jgi:hypothetical protein